MSYDPTIDDLFDDAALTPSQKEGAQELDAIIKETEQERRSAQSAVHLNIQNGISQSNWAQVESYYIDEVRQISIPYEPESADILAIAAAIDRVYTEARFDQAYVSRELKICQRKLSDARKTVYLQVKDVAKNDKERDAYGSEYLESNPMPGDTESILDIVDNLTIRDEFMDAVISVLKAKADKLILAAAALKLEVSLIR